MVRALKNVGALVTNKDGSFAAASDDPVLAAVAGSSDRNEVRDALLHEAMHMVFYVDAQYERACRDYWDAAVSDSDKVAWREFLTELRYNADDETLAVNELQAYMTTERVMFDDGGGGNKGGGNRGGGNNGGRGGEKIETLARMQREFAAHIKLLHGGSPVRGHDTRVVWL